MTNRRFGEAVELMEPGADFAQREEWLAARRGGITASEIATVIGISPWDSAFSLYCVKTGIADEDDTGTTRYSLGHHLEPLVAEEFAKVFDSPLIRAGLCRHQDRAWQLCTPDRLMLAGDLVLPVELKTSATFEGWGPHGSTTVPVYYEAQLRWQMDITGAPAGYLACFFLATQETRIYELVRDEDDVAAMREAAQRFLRRISEHDPPPVGWHKATTAVLKRASRPDDEEPAAEIGRALRIQYEAALRRCAAAERRKREIENRIRLAMGNSMRAVDSSTGELIITRSVYKMRGHTRGETMVDRLNYRKGKPNGSSSRSSQ